MPCSNILNRVKTTFKRSPRLLPLKTTTSPTVLKSSKNSDLSVEKPDVMVERTVDSQKRVFQHPKQAKLTNKARKHLEESETSEVAGYDDMSHKELVETVYELENRVDRLEQKKLGMFQNKSNKSSKYVLPRLQSRQTNCLKY